MDNKERGMEVIEALKDALLRQRLERVMRGRDLIYTRFASINVDGDFVDSSNYLPRFREKMQKWGGHTLIVDKETGDIVFTYSDGEEFDVRTEEYLNYCENEKFKKLKWQLLRWWEDKSDIDDFLESAGMEFPEHVVDRDWVEKAIDEAREKMSEEVLQGFYDRFNIDYYRIN